MAWGGWIRAQGPADATSRIAVANIDDQLLSMRQSRSHRQVARQTSRGPLILDVNADVYAAWSPKSGLVISQVRAVPPTTHLDESWSRTDDPTVRLQEPPHGRVTPALEWPRTSLVPTPLTWLSESVGLTYLRGLTVLVPIVPNTPDLLQDQWHRSITSAGCHPILVHRPLCAAIGLGREVDETTCHMMVEIGEAQVDLSIIRAGSVEISRRLHREDFTSMRTFVEKTLPLLDPDDELAIRDNGVNVYGWSAHKYGREVLDAIGLPLFRPWGRGPTVLDGARLAARDLCSWLATG